MTRERADWNRDPGLPAAPSDPLPCSPETGASRRKDAEGPRVLPQRSEEQGDERLENYSLRVAPEPARA